MKKYFWGMPIVIVLFLGLLSGGCDRAKGQSSSVGISSSQADQLLNEYEATVNSYIPKFKAAKNSVEFTMLVQQLTGEVQSFVNHFNEISNTVNPKDFGRLQARLNQINQKYTALCQRR